MNVFAKAINSPLPVLGRALGIQDTGGSRGWKAGRKGSSRQLITGLKELRRVLLVIVFVRVLEKTLGSGKLFTQK